MSPPTDATDPNALFFPAFCYGDGASCRRRMKAEAKKWAKRYQERGDFPEPKLIPVPPGSLMFCNRGSAEMVVDGWSVTNDAASAALSESVGRDRNAPHWFFYVVVDIKTETALNLPLTTPDEQSLMQRDRNDAAYEAFACRSPWGALALAIRHPLYNTIPAVSQRMEALLRFWEQLDTVRYVDVYPRAVTFTNLMAFKFRGHVAMWVDRPTPDVRQNLRAAIDQMRRASDDEIHTRLIRQLHHVADTRPDLNHREWLKSPGVIETEMAFHAERDWKYDDDIRSGQEGCLSGFLGILDRKFPGG